MSQNITLMGASYSDVPSVELPKTGGGTASFTDTSPTTAAASDVASGKYFFTANGVLTLGTYSGSGTEAGTVTQDENGFLVLDDDAPSGGGLVYESGTLTLAEDAARPVINFSNAHANMPSFVLIADVTDTVASTDSAEYFAITNWYDCFGVGLKSTADNIYYARVQYGYKTSTGITQSGNVINTYSSTSTASSLGYYLSNSSFTPYLGSTTRYFRASTSYKWIAVWEPTS